MHNGFFVSDGFKCIPHGVEQLEWLWLVIEKSMRFVMQTMNTHHLSQAIQSNPADSRERYQKIQVAGLVAPFVHALTRTGNLDAIWAVAFPFEEMVHPTRPTLKLSVVIKRAMQDAGRELMRVDSLESARSVLIEASRYSDWTERAYVPLLELLDLAIADKRSKRGQSRSRGSSLT